MHHEFQTDNLIDSFVGVWKRVTTEPRAFFEQMPVSGGLQNPLVFLAICLGIDALGFLLIGPRGSAPAVLIVGIVMSFAYAGVLMLVARQLFSGAGDYEATYRVVAYSHAPTALAWIPLIGPLAALYGLYLAIVGLERVNTFDAVRSVLTLLLAAIALGAVSLVLGGAAWLMLPLRAASCC